MGRETSKLFEAAGGDELDNSAGISRASMPIHQQCVSSCWSSYVGLSVFHEYDKKSSHLVLVGNLHEHLGVLFASVNRYLRLHQIMAKGASAKAENGFRGRSPFPDGFC